MRWSGVSLVLAHALVPRHGPEHPDHGANDLPTLHTQSYFMVLLGVLSRRPHWLGCVTSTRGQRRLLEAAARRRGSAQVQTGLRDGTHRGFGSTSVPLSFRQVTGARRPAA